MNAVVGRSYDLQAIADWFESVGAQPSALLIEGEAGIGRSTLWFAALEQARDRGFHTLSARASKAEAHFEYATVADLLSEVEGEVLMRLPAVQAAAIDAVLLRGTSHSSAADVHVVAAAFVSVIERLCGNAPVLIGVDDLQWLDSCSRAVMAYVAERLGGRAALLATQPPDVGDAWLERRLPDAVTRIRVGPMCMRELHELLSVRLGRSFPCPTMRRIAETSAGNPFYALELARDIDNGAAGGEPVLPRTLADLVRGRIADLSPDTWQVLLAAACVADPTVEALARATSTSVERVIELLEGAQRQGVVSVLGDRVQYCHPLLARAVYSATGPAQRRQMHGTLANVVAHPELRVRHMALAALSPDPELLHALDGAADAARSRGAPAEAAELLDLAIKLGGDTPWRRTRSAENHLRAGDSVLAGDRLAPAIEQLPPGPQRAFALNLLAGTRAFHSSFVEAASLYKSAVHDADGSPVILVPTLLALSFAQSIAGDYEDALRIARRALAEAEEVGVPALLSQTLANYVTINALDGNGIDEAALGRALELEDPNLDASIVFHPSAAKAQVLAWTGRLDAARAELQELRRRCVAHGAESDLIFVSVHTAMVEIWRGQFAGAASCADEAVQLSEQVGGEQMVCIAKTMRAAAAAYSGREREARADIAGALAAIDRCGTPRLALWPTAIQGFLEVSLGNYDEAAAALQQWCGEFSDMPGTEIVTASFIPDAVEALVALGRLAEAEPMTKALEHNARLFDRPWMLAIGARCRAMLLGAYGDLDAAEQTVHAALTMHNRLPMPFERARTQLLLGQLQRRRRLKIAAATIGAALSAFEDLGNALWVERARAELEQTNLNPTHGDGLTPCEWRVAELVTTGVTSAEAAAELCVSVKSIEARLTRIYRKLGIHSRAELGRWIRTSGQQRLESDAVSPVQRANQLDRSPVDVQRTAVQ